MKYPTTKIVIVTAVGSLRNPTPTRTDRMFRHYTS